MTVPSQKSQITHNCDGVSTVFPVDFYFLADGHLVVTLINTDGTGDGQVLALGSQYSVAGAGQEAGGSVITSGTYPAGLSLWIQRIVPVTQETAYQRNDPFPERAHERALDKLTMIAQQIEFWLGLLPGGISRVLRLGTFDRDGQGAYRARQNRIQDLADPVLEQDATNKRWVTALNSATLGYLDSQISGLRALTLSLFEQANRYAERLVAGVVGGYGTFMQGGIGAVIRLFQDKMRDTVSVRDFGAIGDGTSHPVSEWLEGPRKRFSTFAEIQAQYPHITSLAEEIDWAATQAAVNYLYSIGGGLLSAPPGQYLIANLDKRDNVYIQGYGRCTEFRQIAGSNGNIVSFNMVKNAGLDFLLIKGQPALQTMFGHGVRLENVDGCDLTRLWIEDAPYYGVGAQAGTIRGLRCKTLRIKDSGSDGIDIKNKNSLNEDMEFDDIFVDGYDKKGEGGKTGVDIRGPARMGLIEVIDRNSSAQSCGVRFREGENSDIHGIGGHHSVLVGFRLFAMGVATCFGLAVNARGIKVATGHIKGNGSSYGISEGGGKNFFQQIEILDVNTAIRPTPAGSILTASDGRYSMIKVFRAVFGVDLRVGAHRNSFDQMSYEDVTTAMRVGAAVEDTAIGAGARHVNVTTPLNDGGVRTKIAGNGIGGLTVESYTKATGLSCSSTGSRAFAIPHGLSFTPNPEEVSLTILRETVVTDTDFGVPQIDGVNATNVSGRVVVKTASATPGATFGVAIRVRTKS